MRDLSSLTLPYPVIGLGVYSLDTLNNKDPFTYDIATNSDTYDITIESHINDQYIAELIARKAADLVCEIECSNTHYRKVFRFQGGTSLSFKLKKELLKNKFSISVVAVAIEPIEDYKHPQIQESFDMEKGDLLAYLGREERPIEISDEKLQLKSSFMSVEEYRNQIRAAIDLSGDKIRLFLPTEQFRSFCRLQRTNLKMMYATVVFNALTYALCNITKDDYKDKNWAWVLKQRVEQWQDGLSVDNEADVYEIVQRILEDPYKDLFDELDNNVNSSDDEQ